MKITFYGAAGEVTGSNTLVEAGGHRVLIDCGLFQGGREREARNWDSFPYNPSEIEAVIVTHAHLDHCGRLPKLVKDGFRGSIWTTDATGALVGLQLIDAVEILSEHAAQANREQLFSTNDVVQTLARFQKLPYGHRQSVAPGIEVELRDAGHILGSATARLTAERQTIVFSGDLGNAPVPILNPPVPIGTADYLVLESTYGDRVHPQHKDRLQDLKRAITELIKERGVLLIPAFAFERTQEVLYELNTLIETKQIPSIPVFLDSPLAIDATRVFRHYSSYYNPQTKALLKKGDDPFTFPNLTLTHTVRESKRINTSPAPKVIIAGSGMLEGGRIVHHLVRYLGDDRTILLFVGYQVEGTLGRHLLDGAQTVHVLDERIHVRARIEHLSEFSGHADQNQLLAWAKTCAPPPQRILLNHGEATASHSLCQKLQAAGMHCIVVREGERFTLQGE